MGVIFHYRATKAINLHQRSPLGHYTLENIWMTNDYGLSKKESTQPKQPAGDSKRLKLYNQHQINPYATPKHVTKN